MAGRPIPSSLLREGFLRLTAVASLTRRLMVIFFSLFIKKSRAYGLRITSIAKY